MDIKVLNVVNLILEHNNFNLSLYNNYLKKYGKKILDAAFNYIIENADNKDVIYERYFDAYFAMELDKITIDDETYLKLTDIFEEEKVNKFFNNLLKNSPNKEAVRKKYEQIYFYIDVTNDNNKDTCYNDVSDDSINDYLLTIGNFKIFSYEEEKAIFTLLAESRKNINIAYFNNDDIIFFKDIKKVIKSITTKEQFKKFRKISDYLSEGDAITAKKFIDENKAFFRQNEIKENKSVIYTDDYINRQFDNIITFFETRQKISDHNLKLVVSIAKRYRGQGVDMLDLISSGNIGLLKAIGKFDLDKRSKFSTYATWWIRQVVKRTISDASRTIRIPVHRHEQIIQYKIALNFLSCGSSELPSDEEIMTYLGWDIDLLNAVKEAYFTEVKSSLDTQFGKDDENDSSLMDFIPSTELSPEELYDREELRQRIKEVFKTLTDKERKVIEYRFGFNGKDYTLEEVGQIYGITRERIRQIEAKAIRKLRAPSRRKLIKDYYS